MRLALLRFPAVLIGIAGLLDATDYCYDDTKACGPSHWGDLLPAWEVCKTGLEQSPIDFRRATPDASLAPILFNYLPSRPRTEFHSHNDSDYDGVVNTGHVIQVNYDPGSNATIDGEVCNPRFLCLLFDERTHRERFAARQTYNLVQLHFHAPSEHTFNGVQAVCLRASNAMFVSPATELICLSLARRTWKCIWCIVTQSPASLRWSEY